MPELLVTDIAASIRFWCDLCGFSIEYQRPDEGFAYISRGSAHVMLEQRGIGRNWVTGELDRPFGRGVNFQVSVDDINPVICALEAAQHPLFMDPEEKWYGLGGEKEAGIRQFLVADPDGYLIRFQMSLGHRASD